MTHFTLENGSRRLPPHRPRHRLPESRQPEQVLVRVSSPWNRTLFARRVLSCCFDPLQPSKVSHIGAERAVEWCVDKLPRLPRLRVRCICFRQVCGRFENLIRAVQ